MIENYEGTKRAVEMPQGTRDRVSEGSSEPASDDIEVAAVNSRNSNRTADAMAGSACANPEGSDCGHGDDDEAKTPTAKRRKSLVERRPAMCLVFWLILYPIVFVILIAAGGAWPIRLGRIEDLTKSSLAAYIDYTAVDKIVQQLRSGNPLEVEPLIKQRRRLQSQAKVEIFYELVGNASQIGKPGGIFAYIEEIKKFESTLVPEEFCPPPGESELMAYESLNLEVGKCASLPPLRDSPVGHFYPTIVLNPSPGVAEGRIPNGLGAGSARPFEQVFGEWLTSKVSRYLPRTFSTENEILSMTRSTFYYESDDSGKLSRLLRGPLLAHLTDSIHSIPGVRIAWNNGELLDQELSNAVLHDALLALGSVAVVAVLLFLLLDFSLFLTIIGLISLAYAMPLAYGLFTVTMHVDEIFSLSFLSLYILFGVGSDSCFIYVDEFNRVASGERTVREAWIRGAKATFVTMSTTAVGFLANAASPINVIREWGVFMGYVILFAWLTVATIFPLALLLVPRGRKRRSAASNWLGTTFASVIIRFRYLLLLISLILAILAGVGTFATGGLQPDANAVPAFFRASSSNLGRIFQLKDEFEWVLSGSDSGGGEMPSQLKCAAPDYVLDETKTKCIHSCPEPCRRLLWTVELLPQPTATCLCLFPPQSLADVAAELGSWPPDKVRTAQSCTSCSPTAVLQFEFQSTDESGESLNGLVNDLRAISIGDTFMNYIVVNHSEVGVAATKTPTRLPTFAPTARSPTVSGATQTPTKQQTLTPSSGTPTQSPATEPTTLRPTTRSPTRQPTKVVTSTPTKRMTNPPIPFGQTEAPTPPTIPPTEEPTASPTREPTSSPTTSAPSNAPSTAPTTSQPSSSPTTSRPSTTPTASPSRQPTASPTLPVTSTPTKAPIAVFRCPNDCSSRGTCNGADKKCECFLGFTGDDCSEVSETVLSDSQTERIWIGFGLDGKGEVRNDWKFTSTVQSRIMAICAVLCHANNETETAISGSRCNSFPLMQVSQNLTTFVRDEAGLSKMPIADLAALGFRRVSQCGAADFAEQLLARGAPFPFKESLESMREYIANITSHTFSYANLGRDEMNDIRFVRIEIGTTLSTKQSGASEVQAKFRAWVEFLKQFESSEMNLSPSIGSSLFAQKETEIGTINGFVKSWVITVVVAIVAILAYTWSVLMSLLAGVTVLAVALCVFGVCFYAMGWTFGLVEAVGLTVIVGLTIDYCAHMCYAYVVSNKPTSAEKVQEAIGTIGLAIISSALSTVAACCMLFATTIVPFQTFGTLVCLAITLSLVYAYTFLVPLLVIAGSMTEKLWEACANTCVRAKTRIAASRTSNSVL